MLNLWHWYAAIHRSWTVSDGIRSKHYEPCPGPHLSANRWDAGHDAIMARKIFRGAAGLTRPTFRYW